jgi:hypothetical protein
LRNEVRKCRFATALHGIVALGVIKIAQQGLPMGTMRFVGKCVLFGLAVAAVYFWRGKEVVASDVTQYGTAQERHRLEVLKYRYRPITVWRFAVEGRPSADAQYTYGATETRTVPRLEWCGGGVGVVIQAVVRYDYGESRLTRVFYNFKTGSLLTTLDYQTRDAQIADAVERCNAQLPGALLDPSGPSFR